jgi:hypothetical protein
LLKVKSETRIQKAIGLFNGIVCLMTFFNIASALGAGNSDRALTSFIVGAIMLTIGLAAYKGATPRGSAVAVAVAPTARKPSVDLSSKHFDIAGNEILNGKLEPGLWARALADGNGSEQKAKAYYVKARVAQLQSLESARPANTTQKVRPSPWKITRPIRDMSQN